MMKLLDLLEVPTMEEASGERIAMRAMMPTLVSLWYLLHCLGLSESSFSKSISYRGGYMSVICSDAVFLYDTLPGTPQDVVVFPYDLPREVPKCCGVSSLSQNLHDFDLIRPTRSCATMVTSHSVRYHSEAPSQCEVVNQE